MYQMLNGSHLITYIYIHTHIYKAGKIIIRLTEFISGEYLM